METLLAYKIGDKSDSCTLYRQEINIILSEKLVKEDGVSFFCLIIEADEGKSLNLNNQMVHNKTCQFVLVNISLLCTE